MVKKWHVGCFACSVCDKVFVLKFFNYYFVDIAIYFNSKTILLQMLIAPTCRNRMGFCIARCYLRRHCCKHLFPPCPTAPNQPTSQAIPQQTTSILRLRFPACPLLLRHAPVDYVIIFIIICFYNHVFTLATAESLVRKATALEEALDLK